ncbi:FAD-binding oxidoreductase [Microvirga antarctica]|uniref:FAD-binding oxidoreductase n=1 Tax=Microvirga antarctica TaxID=2819233 RepID=UPI001B30034B|nr:FAD-linked oxidase C-terminal domain-containing protein [Microvirga antarctica]
MTEVTRTEESTPLKIRAFEELSDLLRARFTTNEILRQQHANTIAWATNQPPEAVAYPENEDEVVAIVRICSAAGLPIIPFGTGSSFEGQTNAPFGGVSIDTSRMKRIIAVHDDDMDCVVEPGVTRKELNEYLRDKGLFFPIDPGADASIGGMVATRASGTNAVRYGTMRESVLSLRVVLPNSDVVRTGSRAKKSSAGFDLTRLFVGSEGILGVVTEITLKLHGIAQAISAGICPFPTVKAACDAAIMTIQSGIPIARIELMDEMQIKACNIYSKLNLPEQPMLFVEFQGTENGVIEQAELFGEIVTEVGGGPFEWATAAEDRSRLWVARHDAFWACNTLRPGAKTVATDVCVPLSRLAECVEATQRDIRETGLIATIAGHVGDGNFHVVPLVDMDNPAEIEAIEGFLHRLVERALLMEGTCSGEHGIGQMKRKYMRAEHGDAAIRLMHALKAAVDPQSIMNPGKLLPPL